MPNAPFIFLLSLDALTKLAAGSTVSERSASISQSSLIQHLTLSFESRSQAGKVAVTVQPNIDNNTAFDLSVIYPSISPSNIFAEFHCFPVVKGAITYPMPASPHPGYRPLFSWIQFIKKTTRNVIGDYAVDSYPFASDLDDDHTNETVIWRAQTCLSELVDGGDTKNVTVVKGGAFTWGYNMSFDADGIRRIVITKAELLDANGADWDQRVPLLTKQCPEWTFNNSTLTV